MNSYALVSGLIVIVFLIVRFRQTRLEYTSWAYPVLLASFPVFYFIFAIYARDLSVLGYELLAGLVFFILAFAAYQANIRVAAFLIATGSLLHAVYDFYHDRLFINPGVPDWWPAFCASIDVVLGIYLLYFSLTQPNKASVQ